jgi:preprotein translocase subunit SecE
MIDRFATFLKEARIELKKVTWPTRQETIRYTGTVVVISIALAIFLGTLDALFQFVLNKFLLQ